MKNTLFIFIAASLLLASCKTSKQASPGINSKDSTVHTFSTGIVEKANDTFFKVEYDYAWLEALLACDSNNQVMMKQILDFKSGEHANIPAVKIDKNVLTVKNTVDSFAIYFAWKDRMAWLNEVKTIDKSEEITLPPVKVNYLTWFQKFFIKSGKIAWALLLLYGGFKLLTNRIKIIQQIRKWVA